MAIDRTRMTSGYFPLRDVIDRLFEGSFVSPQQMTGQMAFPPANLRVTDDAVVVEMAIPGVNPEDINISISGDTVTISGEGRREKQDEKGQMYVEEIWEGSFQRSFTLPFPVDADKAQATFENGMLRLTLPKSEAAKPRKVQVSPRRALHGQEKSPQAQTQQHTDSGIEMEQVPAKSG